MTDASAPKNDATGQIPAAHAENGDSPQQQEGGTVPNGASLRG